MRVRVSPPAPRKQSRPVSRLFSWFVASIELDAPKERVREAPCSKISLLILLTSGNRKRSDRFLALAGGKGCFLLAAILYLLNYTHVPW
jgi:hypothetical protein